MSIASEISRINQNIAAAYTACSDKGATMPAAQNSDHLPDTISSIHQGDNTDIISKYVNFIDVDGTILYSYTEAEVQQLTELPSLPIRDGYIYQEWNWTLAEIQSYGFPLTVGAVRVPSDGKTHLTLELIEGDDLTVSIPFYEEAGREVSIDWGDGTSVVCTSSPAVHTFASYGRYVVRADSNDYFMLNVSTYQQKLKLKLSKAEFGLRSKIKSGVLSESCALRLVSIPKEITIIEANAFQDCKLLTAIVFPSNVTGIQNYAFNGCETLRMISFPGRNLSEIGSGAFANNYSVRCISLPESLTIVGSFVFRVCRSLEHIALPHTIVELQSGAFQANINLRKVDLSAFTSVPRAEGSNTFFGAPQDCVLYVRNAAMLSAFQSATNWSVDADKMQIGGKYAEI